MLFSGDERVRWDVGMALRDLSLEMLDHHGNGRSASPETILRWHQSLRLAHRAHNALAWACESLVEEGATPGNLEEVRVALAHAMGQRAYCARSDRW